MSDPTPDACPTCHGLGGGGGFDRDSSHTEGAYRECPCPTCGKETVDTTTPTQSVWELAEAVRCGFEADFDNPNDYAEAALAILAAEAERYRVQAEVTLPGIIQEHQRAEQRMSARIKRLEAEHEALGGYLENVDDYHFFDALEAAHDAVEEEKA